MLRKSPFLHGATPQRSCGRILNEMRHRVKGIEKVVSECRLKFVVVHQSSTGRHPMATQTNQGSHGSIA